MVQPLSGHAIVHLLTSVQHGGAERVVLELARSQRDLGAVVGIVCLQQRGELAPAFESAGLTVSLVPGGGKPGALRMAWRLSGMLRNGGTNPTVVHTHNTAPQIAAGLGQYLRRWRHGDTVLVHTEHGRLPSTRPALVRWRRLAIAKFDAVVAVSVDAQRQMLQYRIQGANGVSVIVNGVDLSRYVMRGAARPARARLVHVGRLDRVKGQDILISAMPIVRALVPEVRLSVVGDGPTRGQLGAQAEALGVADIVDFVGAVDDVRPFLQDADIFVLPSRSEGISIALLEAMATGLAVVATDVGGNREVVQTGISGQLVAAERPDELAAALAHLLLNSAIARAAGIAGRREVEARFASDQTTAGYTAVYQQALAARNSQPMSMAA